MNDLGIGAVFRRAGHGLLTPSSEPAVDAISYYWLFLFTTVYVL